MREAGTISSTVMHCLQRRLLENNLEKMDLAEVVWGRRKLSPPSRGGSVSSGLDLGGGLLSHTSACWKVAGCFPQRSWPFPLRNESQILRSSPDTIF